VAKRPIGITRFHRKTPSGSRSRHDWSCSNLAASWACEKLEDAWTLKCDQPDNHDGPKLVRIMEIEWNERRKGYEYVVRRVDDDEDEGLNLAASLQWKVGEPVLLLPHLL
jgi:hypothetical protein